MRWGLGPVFVYECLAHSRRWQTYALRSLGVALLLLAMATIATSSPVAINNSARDYASLGEAYFAAMIGVELALVMLIAPAATAGAICLDRARGTLAHMLMTDLSDPEIVLGKLAARLLPVLGLVACTWPVMAISSLLGGIDPIALTLAFAIIVVVAILGCTIALAIFSLGPSVARGGDRHLSRVHRRSIALADLVSALVHAARQWPVALALAGQSVLCGVCALYRPGRPRFAELLRFLQRYVGGIGIFDDSGGCEDTARGVPRFERPNPRLSYGRNRSPDALAPRSVARPQSRILA